jgi:hypothetical protein
LRLPSFVTAASLCELLNWANSIKREFRDAALVSGIDGWTSGDADSDVYEDIVLLLGRSRGGFHLDRLVTAADGEKRRGLSRALHKRVVGVLGSDLEKSDSAAVVVLKLSMLDHTDLAAWVAFDKLSSMEGPGAEDDELVDLLRSDEVLRASLGDYWGDWLAISGRDEDASDNRVRPASPARTQDERLAEGASSSLEADEDRDSEAESSKADRLAWDAELTDLRAIFDRADPFDGSVVERLTLATTRLDLLVARAAERTDHDALRLGDLAVKHVEQLRDDLGAIGGDVAWRAALLDAAARVPVDHGSVDRLAATAAWAAAVRAGLEAAERRRQAAIARVQTDDGEEAGAEFTAANAERRRLRQRCDAEAAGWIDELSSSPSPAASPDSTVLAAAFATESSADDDVLANTIRDTAASFETDDDGPDTSGPGLDLPMEAKTNEEVVDALPTVVEEIAAELAIDAFGPSSAPGPGDAAATDEAAWAEAPQEELRLAAYHQLVDRALLNGRYGLATHLQRAMEVLTAAESPPATAAVLEALCIGGAITASRLGAAESRYIAVLPRVLADLGRSAANADSLRVLAFAGAIKPALFTMQTSAAEAIRAAAIGGLGTNLHELAEFVVEQLPKRGGVIDLAALRPVADEQKVRDEVERFRMALVETADGAPAKKALFARASIIWRDLFQKEGTVLRAVNAVRRQASNAAELAQEAGDELARHLDERARELDRAAKRNRDAWLEGKALEWLLTSLRELTDLMHGYAAAARRVAGPRSSHTSETQKMLFALVAAARKDVARCAQRDDLSVAANVAGRVLDDVMALLEGRTDSTNSALGVDALLDGDLLLIRPYPVDARRRALTRESAAALLEGAAEVTGLEADFLAAFDSLVEVGRFDEATEAADRIAGQGGDRAKLDQTLADARLERLDRLEKRAVRLRAQLDDLLGADIDGRIDPASSVQLEGLIGSIVSPELDSSEVARRLDFPAIESELARLETAGEDHAELLLAPLRREIDALEGAGRPVGILRQLAEKGELTTLRECVNGLKAGAEMDLTGRQEKLLRFFADGFLSQQFAQADPKQRNLGELVQAVKERREGDLVNFSMLAEDDVPAAEGLLTAWIKLKRTTGEEAQAALRELLTELRFTNVRISNDRPLPRARRYTVLCAPTSDRRDCPVPAFGSAAGGRLEVLVLEAIAVGDGVELHGLVKGLDSASTVPTLVIVKGLLSADRRLSFMREARRRAGQEPCALLDEAGVLFLSTWPARRRADLFAVALPGGGVQPYSDTSGKTSPEMFFGRSAELGELWRPDGSCLVFGGRQLGKTALLEQVRLRNHKPPSQVVVYGSLQGEKDIWRKVGELLADAGVAVKGHSATAVEGAVREWLGQDATRRILVLVDEADTYLEAEMQDGYQSLARIRDLMQATDRRCKFVFAGLHNVQRLARAPNSPLLHFGTPLRIGPLFGHDLGEAREMVVGPMAAAGIVFENATLPNRILSAVGFYPSLLQTLGATLIDRVNRSAHGRLKVGSLLPVVVAEHDIQNALEDHDFKENIRQKFRMTLSLDERYRLITLAMLQRALDRREQTSVAPSLTDVEVQALAREWWPQGFEEDSSLDAFQGLLSEMVGLGVLVESGGRYAIRSSRIAAMLGGKEQIEQELVELSESPGPQKLDTGSLRRLDKTTKAPSPLTSRQESGVLGRASAAPSIHLALGSRALGLDRVAAALKEPQDDEPAVRTGVYKTARDFMMQLATTAEGLRSGRRNLLVLAGPWLGREMVDMALEAGSRRSGRSAGLRVLVVPSWIDWQAVDGIDDQGRLWGADLLSLSTLGRSGLGQWLRARGAPETLQSIDGLRALTGGYPLYLSGLGRASDLMSSAREAHDRHVSHPDTLASLGLDDERLLAAARIVAEFEPDDPVADFDNMGVGPGEKVVGHLERLGIMERTSDTAVTRWRLNPFVSTVLAKQP